MSTVPPSGVPTISDWLRVERALAESAQKLEELAEQYMNGQVTIDELNEMQETVRALRTLSDAVLSKILSDRE